MNAQVFRVMATVSPAIVGYPMTHIGLYQQGAARGSNNDTRRGSANHVSFSTRGRVCTTDKSDSSGRANKLSNAFSPQPTTYRPMTGALAFSRAVLCKTLSRLWPAFSTKASSSTQAERTPEVFFNTDPETEEVSPSAFKPEVDNIGQ